MERKQTIATRLAQTEVKLLQLEETLTQIVKKLEEIEKKTIKQEKEVKHLQTNIGNEIEKTVKLWNTY